MNDREILRKKLKEVADELERVIREEIKACVILYDSGRLNRLVTAIDNHMSAEVIHSIRQHWNGQNLLDELCKKVGVQENLRKRKSKPK